jgi:hypothetical protein
MVIYGGNSAGNSSEIHRKHDGKNIGNITEILREILWLNKNG